MTPRRMAMKARTWGSRKGQSLFLVILILCSLFLFQGLGAEMAQSRDVVGQGPVRITMEEKGKEVVVRKGETLEIELRTHATAGYSWQFETLDGEYLEVTGKESRAMSDRMGAPVMMTWRLKAKKAGATKIEMDNYRVWEGKEKSVNQFSIRVRIE
jgi:predicted secreted protein